jgi:hypothetical protein
MFRLEQVAKVLDSFHLFHATYISSHAKDPVSPVTLQEFRSSVHLRGCVAQDLAVLDRLTDI